MRDARAPIGNHRRGTCEWAGRQPSSSLHLSGSFLPLNSRVFRVLMKRCSFLFLLLWLQGLIGCMFLGAQIYFMPYKSRTDNLAETFCQLILIVLCMFLSTAGTPVPYATAQGLSAMCFLVVALLVLRIVVDRCSQLQRARREREQRRSSARRNVKRSATTDSLDEMFLSPQSPTPSLGSLNAIDLPPIEPVESVQAQWRQPLLPDPPSS